MKKFEVTFFFQGSKTYEVEANSPIEAESKARDIMSDDDSEIDWDGDDQYPDIEWSLTTNEIVDILDKAFSGTERKFFTEKELVDYAMSVNVNNQYDDNDVADAFVQKFWGTDKQVRRCSRCGKLFKEGYVFNQGEEYYCSNECLHEVFTDEEWRKECNENDQSYYTELF